APATARLRLIQDGRVVAEKVGRSLSYTTQTPGAYRAEAWKPLHGRERGWIFSNPIYVRE
ncbi:MAG: histidinol phosphatase, partial [Anaerolineae bacterium]|nr:histidinol phosphatase [Anaerolineae bacterium]